MRCCYDFNLQLLKKNLKMITVAPDITLDKNVVEFAEHNLVLWDFKNLHNEQYICIVHDFNMKLF